MLTVSNVRCHLNMAVLTGHAQGVTKVREHLRIIFENLQNANFFELELLEVPSLIVARREERRVKKNLLQKHG